MGGFRIKTKRWGVYLPLLIYGCALPAPVLPSRGAPSSSAVAVGILRKGWHTDLVFPQKELVGPLRSLHRRFPHAPFLTIGFGNRAYYTARNPGLLKGLRALFPSPGALHVAPWDRTNTKSYPTSIHWCPLTAQGWRGLQTFLARSFSDSTHGLLKPIGTGTPQGQFFASRRTYDAFNTCNTWTASALHAGGLPVKDAGVIFSGQVIAALPQSATSQK